MLLSSCGTWVNSTLSYETDATTPIPNTTQIETCEQPTTIIPNTTTKPNFFEEVNQIFYPFPDMFTQYDKTPDGMGKIGDLFILQNLIQESKKEPNVPQTMVWNFKGVDYELVYDYSTFYIWDSNFTDIYVDYYKCTDSKSGLYYVVFEHNTTIIREIKIGSQPCFNSEAEYVDYISDILGVIIDVSEYEINCVTTYDDVNGDNVEVDFFYNVKEGEKLRRNELNFILKKDDCLTNSRIYCTNLKGTVYIRNFSWNDQYKDQLSFTQSEIDYAGNLINNWTDEVSFRNHSLVKFKSINFLNGKKFLVYSFTFWDNPLGYWGESLNQFDNSYKDYREAEMEVYVDYERLQQKMALEGVNP